jgi:hypothetical protein
MLEPRVLPEQSGDAAPVTPDATAPIFASRRERREYEQRLAEKAAEQADVALVHITEPEPTAPVVVAEAEPVTQQIVVIEQPHTEPQPLPAEPKLVAPEPLVSSTAPTEDAMPEASPSLAAPAPLPQPAARPTRRAARKRDARPLATQQRAAAHPPHAHRKSRVARVWVKGAMLLAAVGLVATASIPAYAWPDATMAATAGAVKGTQSLRVGNVAAAQISRDTPSVIENNALLDSTTGNVVSPTVQRLAQELMDAVAQGRLIGSTPDHIPEIRNLAEGRAVPGCGVDYRVLKTIQLALNNFHKVGVSDINRRCTGQIEGAGTASAHYTDGGGHAVDFYLLDGHPLTGGDAKSIELIKALDPYMPAGTHLGQIECRADIALSNFAPFADTCNHVHIDFGSTESGVQD